MTTELEWRDLTIGLSLEKDGDLHVTKEKITSPNSTVPLYRNYQCTLKVQEATYSLPIIILLGVGKKPSIVCSSHMAIFHTTFE